MNSEGATPANQRGLALVLSLVFLAIVTLVSLSSMQGSMVQRHMAVNQQEYSMALQAAEAALQEAERILEEGRKPTSGWSSYSSDSASFIHDPEYRMLRQTGEVIGSRVTSQGVETLEVLYRIEAKGFGRSKETNVNLEAVYVRIE
ncbi:PilX N-terminal domain-containing pilus assembly protein [Halomonas sp. HNIBRBA4712]|uniref:pilus assembly PilX family protein n=1 Tax=Halomonas sp. HNIBRBA4712 TaxID=3373087 RepID=UPI003746D199